jgi:amino acid adenylation domain-containing protein
VALHATHTTGTVVGLLGVWAAGGTYCPVDPAFPAPRRRAMVAAAGCRTVLDPATLPEPNGAGPAPVVAMHPDDPAYVLFTSGSTAEPKPVLTPRRAVDAVVPALCDLFGLTPDDRVLQFASLNWDTCFEEILPTLAAGATLVFHPEAYTGSFRRFLRMVEAERITVLDLPTAFWHELVHHLAEDPLDLPACVRLVVIGGEPVNPARLAEWRALDTGRVRLLNTYGCTETTLITHAADLHGPLVDPDAVRAGGPVPIGRALPHVLERIGPDGELLVGGPAVALGYRGMPAATDDRFVVIGACLRAERYFRTGDRVRRLPDGILLHEGRIDAEVKIRGIRVNPAEVEQRIAGHPDVAAVAVVAETRAGRPILAAYVVPHPAADSSTDTDALPAAIAAQLRTQVPGHLVPSRIAVVSELTYTASGKVDRAGTHRRHTDDRPLTGALR